MRDILSSFGIVTIALILINVIVFFAIQVPDKPYYTLEWTTDCKKCGPVVAEYKGEKYLCPHYACDEKECNIDKCEKLSECCVRKKSDRLSLIPKFALQEPWLFITSMFMHANIEHLLGNMIFLFILGGIVENIIGRRNYIILYFAAGIF
ncbi:MAG: rhomboid family intramembrane serine protease, partial [Candidatus Altarchaeaceae archaeon]